MWATLIRSIPDFAEVSRLSALFGPRRASQALGAQHSRQGEAALRQSTGATPALQPPTVAVDAFGWSAESHVDRSSWPKQ